ncbi:hypothetical protein D3C80_1969250 [compost metagenome]
MQAEVPAFAEDFLQARLVALEQLVQLEGEHQVGQAPAIQLPDHLQQLAAWADMAEQGQAGELHQAFGEGGVGRKQGALLFGVGGVAGQQLAQAQGRLRHRW